MPTPSHCMRLRLLLMLLIASSFVIRNSSFAQSASPQLIPFQGRLTNQQGVVYTSGQYSITFNIYSQAVGGSTLWTERHEKVGVTNGMVNVFLGSITTLSNVDFGTVKYLGITIDADNNPATADPEMVPRQMIIPSFYAKNSETLNRRDWTYLNPPGTILVYAGSSEPQGYKFCNGQSLDKNQYLNLFAVIGTTYGGDGNPMFNLPDLKGRVPAGKDDMGGTSASNLLTSGGSGINGLQLGAFGGAQAQTSNVTVSQQPSFTVDAHTHGLNSGSGWALIHADTIAGINYKENGGTASWTSSIGTGAGSRSSYTTSQSRGTALGGTTDAAGASTTRTTNTLLNNGSISVVQPTIVLNYIIKY